MPATIGSPRVFSLLACVFLLLRFSFAGNRDATVESQVTCSKSCVAESCNSIGIQYGKFCGVGWTGCPGEKPCDDLDACCMAHDECVGKKGLTNVKCHEKMKRCMNKVKKSGKVGFSKDCPYEVAIPIMTQGMDMAIMLSQLGGFGGMEQES
ncbi:putative phospholipase A2 like 1 [Apostasia shenzhenica]|uniref:phospholipase A2 n=1 Tax=Apostasia shenzhenica TaxID=1088818 RepID=A0A2I0AYK2_9ASPA|nr:putative phospholipase A2 like 1 [Apostasia shenzhenica]